MLREKLPFRALTVPGVAEVGSKITQHGEGPHLQSPLHCQGNLRHAKGAPWIKIAPPEPSAVLAATSHSLRVSRAPDPTRANPPSLPPRAAFDSPCTPTIVTAAASPSHSAPPPGLCSRQRRGSSADTSNQLPESADLAGGETWAATDGRTQPSGRRLCQCQQTVARVQRCPPGMRISG